MRLPYCLLLAIVTNWWISPSACAQKTFEVGGAFADITPRRSLANYNAGMVDLGENSSLEAHAVVCSDGTKKVVFISVDATFIHREIVMAVRDELHRRIGLNPRHVLVAATHSHATPATGPSFLSGALADPQYVDLLIDGVVKAVELANSRLQPARYVAGTLPIPSFVHNRRRLSAEGQAYFPSVHKDPDLPSEGPIDREMHYAGFETSEGDPIAFLLAVPCHNNVSTGSGGFHGDMFNKTARQLRERLKKPALATVTLAAPCGDVAWMLPDGSRGVANDIEAGKMITDSILDSLGKRERQTCSKLAIHSVLERMPDRSYKDSTFCRDDCRGSSDSDRIRKRYDPEEMAVKVRGQTFYNVEVQAIAFGSVAVVTNPAELFSIYGVRIKAKSPFKVTLVSELSNGYCGYVPTKEAFNHGGYETHRTVYTSRLFKGAGDLIQKLSIEQLQEVWKKLNSKK